MRVLVLALLLPGLAWGDEGEALRVFNKGRAALNGKRTEEACRLFEQSHELLPTYGAKLNLGECNRRLGRMATAARWLRGAVDISVRDGRPERVEDAMTILRQVEPEMARVRFVIDGAAEVWVDGVAVPPEELAQPVALDAGRHEVEARAGGQRWTGSVQAVARETGELRIRIAPAVEEVAVVPRRERGRTQRVVGLALGGVGVASLVVGSVFGVRAIDKWGEADCPDGLCSSTQGLELGEDADRAADLANVFVAGGLVLIGTGVVVWLTAPSPGGRVSVVPNGAGAALRVTY